MWPLAVIAAGLAVGLVLSVLGIGLGRGQERTLSTVDADGRGRLVIAERGTLVVELVVS